MGVLLLLQAVHPLAVLVQIGLGVGGVLALGQDVDLDLGLRAGGTDDDGGAVGHLKAQHVGAGELHGGFCAGGTVHNGAVGVVLALRNRHTGEFGGGILPERLHQIGHVFN